MNMTTERDFEKDGLVWLLVGAVGFFFGFGWITGPLGWYFGGRLKREIEDNAVRVPDVVRAAHIVGIVTTLVTYVAFAVLAVVVAIFGAALFSGAIH